MARICARRFSTPAPSDAILAGRIAASGNRFAVARLTTAGALDADATTTTQYVWDIRYIDSPVCRDRDLNGDGDATDAADQHIYYATDANFNVTALIDAATGQVVERYQYTPYGEVTVLNGAAGADPDVDGQTVLEWSPDPDNASDVGNVLGFTGARLDSPTGLILMRNRYTHPSLGRFLTNDPAQDGVNLYEYCGGSPIGAVDPQGLKLCVSPAGANQSVKDHIMELLRILNPSAKWADEAKVSIDVAQGGTLPARLVAQLAKMKTCIYLTKQSPRWRSSPNNQIFIGDRTVYTSFFSDAQAGEPFCRRIVTSRRFPDSDKEEAALLAHERIHAIYRLQGQARMQPTQEYPLWRRQGEPGPLYDWMTGGSGSGQSAEEEFFTDGLSIVMETPDWQLYVNYVKGSANERQLSRTLMIDKTNPTVTFTVMRFDAAYTENKVRWVLGLPRRESYEAGFQTTRPLYQTTGKAPKLTTRDIPYATYVALRRR